MKRILSFLLALTLVIACAPVVPLQANAATSGYYTYTVSNGEATITDCNTAISGDIVIPDTLGGYPVTSIGNYAFNYCSSLTSVTIPDSVTSIGSFAFSDCSKLTSVTIGNNVTSIGYEAFYYCSSLTSIEIPDSVTSIGHYAFAYCSSLTSVTIPDSVTSIGHYAFCDCSSLTSVTIGDGVTSIGNSAFYDCSKLTNVTIGDGVTTIGNSAFCNCDRLISVKLPDSVTNIGGYAFSGCDFLKRINIPQSVASIGNGVFANCMNLSKISVDENNLFYFCDDAGVLYSKNQEKLLKAPITISGDYTILDGVINIEECAFYNCVNLTGVKIPDNISSIGDYAFAYCSSLTSVTIPDSVTSIGSFAFCDCSKLTSVTIGNNVTSIGYEAFYKCSSLTSIEIPDSVTSIGTWTFGFCSELKSVVFGDGITSVEACTFQDCSRLSSVVIPESVTYIEQSAFQWCSKLTDVYYLGTEEQKEDIAISTHNNDGLTSATWYYEATPCKHIEEDGTEKLYPYVEDALTNINSGTVKMLVDATVDTVVLKPGVTLDLNGNTLTADLFVAMNGARVLDGGEECTSGGSLKIAKENLVLDKDNGGVIPVWNGVDGYVFTKVILQQIAKPVEEGVAQYIFLPTFSNADAAALLADGGADNGLKIKVSLVWGNGQSQQFYTYDDAFVEQVFASNGVLAFSLTVTGIGSITDMVASPVIVTDAYAQATTTGTALTADK